jgi:hypothetical protein
MGKLAACAGGPRFGQVDHVERRCIMQGEIEKRPPGRDTRRPLARLPAPDLLRFRRKVFGGGPTCDVVRTIHAEPNQTAGPTAWPNRIYANFVAKTVRLNVKARSRA